MKMPNKVTPYKESSIAKFPVILAFLEKRRYDTIGTVFESEKGQNTEY